MVKAVKGKSLDQVAERRKKRALENLARFDGGLPTHWASDEETAALKEAIQALANLTDIGVELADGPAGQFDEAFSMVSGGERGRPAPMPITLMPGFLKDLVIKGPEPARKESPAQGLPTIQISSLLITKAKVSEGLLISAQTALWTEIATRLGSDWKLAYQLTPTQWEEIAAGAYKKEGFDEVILTPRSGDGGRDVIAIKKGRTGYKIINSMKAYGPNHVVGYDDIRALMGVMSSERDVSKGMLTTTSRFPPNVWKDRFIAPLIPTRLELVDGEGLQAWLKHLAGQGR